jgi:hypothetical protein
MARRARVVFAGLIETGLWAAVIVVHQIHNRRDATETSLRTVHAIFRL